MKKKVKFLRFWFTLGIITTLLLRVSSQPFHQPGTIQISTNPVKLIMGLVNVEVEYIISPEFSIQLSSEYLVSDYAIRRGKHPDFVLRFGPRYHFFHHKDYNTKNDLYAGINGGYIWSKSNVKHKSGFLGMDIGYKYMVCNPVYINSKFLIPNGLFLFGIFLCPEIFRRRFVV